MDPESTVYIVDDDEEMRRSLRRLLDSVNQPVQECSSASEFLTTFDPTGRGCVVLDVRMPGMSGIDLQRKLDAEGMTIPIIFINVKGDIPMVVKAMKSGAVDFIIKPFKGQELLDRVHQVLVREAKALKRIPAQPAHAVRT